MRPEFNQKIETLQMTQDKTVMRLNNSVTQLGNSLGSLTGRMNQTDDIISRLEDRVEDLDQLDQISKEYLEN